MATIAWTLVAVTTLLGCFVTLELGRSLGRTFLSGACRAAGVGLGLFGLCGLLWGPFGGPAETLWLAAGGFFLAVAITAAVRLFKLA